MKRFAPLFLLAIVTLMVSTPVSPVRAADVSLSIENIPEKAIIGQELLLNVKVALPAGATLSADGLELLAETPGGEAFYTSPYPAKILSTSPGTALVEWAAPLPNDLKPADHQLQLTLKGQTVDGTALSGSWQGTIKVDFGSEWDANKISNFIEQRGMFLFMLLLFGFGLLMSLSPCIYPMIPITLAVIGAQSKEKGIMHGLTMSVTYVIGMALVYAIIGYLSATAASGIIAYMQSPTVMIPIAILLLVLSLSMFGAYELQAPQFMRDKLGSAGGNRSGLVGVFFMGMIAGLIASPCVGPFLGGLLLMLATTGDGILAFFSLFTFGMGMGVLLICVGTFPALLGSMPQAGGWMETLNRGMGLMLVGMALYFLRPGSVIPAQYFYPLLGGIMVVVGVFMGAFDSQSGGVYWWDRIRKGLGILAVVAGLIFFVGSSLQFGFLNQAWTSVLSEGVPAAATPQPVAGVHNPVQQAVAEAAAPLPAKVQWEKIHTGEGVKAFIDSKRAEAKAAGKPVIIDFWATWCVYCKKLDKVVWNQPEVVAESLRFTTIKVDATKPDDEDMTAVKDEYQVPGLPKVIFIDSRGEVLLGRSVGFEKAPDMLKIMQGIR